MLMLTWKRSTIKRAMTASCASMAPCCLNIFWILAVALSAILLSIYLKHATLKLYPQGLFTRGLPPLCSRLTAMDPGQDMVEQAQKSLKDTKTRAGHSVEFKQGGAEELDSFADASVDVITAATAGESLSAKKGVNCLLIEI